MIKIDPKIEGKKERLFFNKIGKNIKKLNEGMIIIKVELVKAMTFSRLFVSQYNHINAKKVVKGIDIIIPAKNDERLAISEAATTIIAVITVFIIKYIIGKKRGAVLAPIH